MKKLMIAAAAAAMIAGVQAAECVSKTLKDECGIKVKYNAGASAYKFSASVKTTNVKKKSTSDKCGVTDCEFWKVQATKKFAGVILADVADCSDCQANGILPADVGYFWNTTDKTALDGYGLALVIGRIDKNGKKVEAYGNFGALTIAGFGSLYQKGGSTDKCGVTTDCNAYVKSISGNLAGFLPYAYNDPCGCDAIVYDCDCGGVLENTTAASGTWKLSYDASLAKKIANAAIKAAAADSDDDEIEEEDIEIDMEEAALEYAKLPAYVVTAIAAGEYTPGEVVIEESDEEIDVDAE